MNSGVNHSVKICFDTEWPVYFERSGNNRRKTNGNINIVQLASNVTDYTVILELYNFKDNDHLMRAIAQKLNAIFSLKVKCFTGCRQKADYTMLQNQYSHFNFPQEVYELMDDVSIMAINRGLTKRGKGKATLQALCMGEGRFLKKPEHVRLGTCFNSRRGSLSQEALKYCQLDVEAPLILHSIYMGKPDLTERLKSTDQIDIGAIVDIMPSTTSIEVIAQGKVKKLGPTTWGERNRLTVGRHQVLIEVEKVFNPRGVIHYPCTNRTATKCECGRKVHGTINENCTFYLYSQFGKPPYLILELKTRLRKYNDLINYPETFEIEEDNEEDEDLHISALTNEYSQSDEDNEEESVSSGGEHSDDDLSQSINEGTHLTLTADAIELLQGNDDNGYDSDSSSVTIQDDEPTEEQIRAATDQSLNDTIDQIISDADKLADFDAENAVVINQINEEGLQIDELPKSLTYKSVLGDIFHFMDRAKLPMHHEYKALFFRALRASVFIMYKQDVEDVKTVLEGKGIKWETKMAFDFEYIASRVRRRVPKADVLYHRVNAVFKFFADKKDTTTGVKLFSDKNKKNSITCWTQ